MRILAQVMEIEKYSLHLLRIQSNMQSLFSDEFCAN